MILGFQHFSSQITTLKQIASYNGHVIVNIIEMVNIH
jgi:hypothetical protein